MAFFTSAKFSMILEYETRTSTIEHLKEST